MIYCTCNVILYYDVTVAPLTIGLLKRFYCFLITMNISFPFQRYSRNPYVQVILKCRLTSNYYFP